jgi:transposase
MMHSIKEIDFESLIAKEKNGRMRTRLLALAHIKDGANKTQAASYLKVTRRIVNVWVKRFNDGGIDALKEKQHTGRPCALSSVQLEKLSGYISENSIKPNGGRLKATLLITYIEEEFGIKYRIANIYRLLHQLEFSWITSRSMHPKQSIEAQEDFKKNSK